MSKRTVGCIVTGIGIYAVLSIVLVLVVMMNHEDYHSSPTISRNVPQFIDGRLGILKDFSRKVEQVRPAEMVMDVPSRWNGKGGSFLLEWENKKTIDKGTPVDPWVDDLLGNEEVELIAYGLWIPQPDDPFDSPDWNPVPIFRTSDGSTKLSEKDLEVLGVPQALWQLSAPVEYHTPRLSLLLRTKNIPHVRFTNVQAGDARTEAAVSYDIESLGEQNRSTTIGEWTRLDLALLLWHDTTLKVQAAILTGTPTVAEMKTRLGEQLVFGDQLRIQWVGGMKDDPSVDSYVGSFEPNDSVPDDKKKELDDRDPYSSDFPTADIFHFYTDKEPDPVPSLIVRASSDSYLQNHCGLITEGSIEWDWSYAEEEEDMYFASLNVPAPKGEAKFLFIPNRTVLEFVIPALPDMPNPRHPEDLFDITIPRLTIPEGVTYDAERQLLGYVGVATQLAWDSDLIWSDHPPKELPPQSTFQNETPQSLINWYLEKTPTAHVEYDEAGLLLKFNESEDTWWDRFTEFISSLGIL